MFFSPEKSVTGTKKIVIKIEIGARNTETEEKNGTGRRRGGERGRRKNRGGGRRKRGKRKR